MRRAEEVTGQPLSKVKTQIGSPEKLSDMNGLGGAPDGLASEGGDATRGAKVAKSRDIVGDDAFKVVLATAKRAKVSAAPLVNRSLDVDKKWPEQFEAADLCADVEGISSGANLASNSNSLYYDILSGGQDCPSIGEELPKETRKDRISSLPEFKAHAEAHQWNTRRERGIPWKQDVFEYVRDVYASWIERGQNEGRPLTQADIKVVDKPLWEKFQQESSKRGVPDYLALPARHVVLLQDVSDPEERALRERMRDLERQRSQLRRQLKKLGNGE